MALTRRVRLPRPVARRLNIAFVNYHDFTSNSAVHIFNLANELTGLGCACAVCVPNKVRTVSNLGTPHFEATDFRTATKRGLQFPDGGPPTLIHAWTPRELVRTTTEELSARYDCPFVVHLEDNEDAVAAHHLGIPLEQLHLVSPDEISQKFSHPARSQAFLAHAAGVSVIIDRLLEFVPPDTPAEVIWPAFEPTLFNPAPPDPALRAKLDIPEDCSIIVYPGNAHAANAEEMRSLHLAVAAVNRVRPLKLVRLGRDFCNFLGSDHASVEPHVVRVELQPRARVGDYVRLADVLVQPGHSDPFNDYRFPSKLPEFLATGRPVILPDTNLGRYLRDEEECILLHNGDALEIAAAIERLLGDRELRDRVGRGGRAFATANFSWQRSAQRLKLFYEHALDRLAPNAPPSAVTLERIRARYSSFSPPALSYATARDYGDSADHLPLLAKANHDMKDVQRPWVLKAILGTVPAGGRLLEIGAGEPIVADLLARLGYEVWVIDPYDGRDGGPADGKAIEISYPDVRVICGVFPGDLSDAPTFDCIYSISVLEHIPQDAVADVTGAIKRLVRPGGRTIHAVDHVLRGSGDADHLGRLQRLVTSLGIPQRSLLEVLETLEDDVETYFLSAESHNRWRGALPYEEFPMRRCVSIQLCVPVAEHR